jgi:hypothetical protein
VDLRFQALHILEILISHRIARLSPGSSALPLAVVALAGVVRCTAALLAATVRLVALLAVRSMSATFVSLGKAPVRTLVSVLTPFAQLPYNVGWQDLKDLFRQAGV